MAENNFFYDNSGILSGDESRKTVRLTLISRHSLPDASRAGMLHSLFEQIPQRMTDTGSTSPEDYPEEMDEALRIIQDNDAGADSRFGFNDYDPDDDGLDGEMRDTLMQQIEEFAQMLADNDADSENLIDNDDAYVFRSLANMTARCLEDGSEEIEISYDDHQSLDNTATVILYNTSTPDALSIIHTGDVASTIVCERGVRHFSAYKTPIMPFEVAVYTRKFDGSLSFERGGEIELDYIVEIRGADVQRTRMKICVDIL